MEWMGYPMRAWTKVVWHGRSRNTALGVKQSRARYYEGYLCTKSRYHHDIRRRKCPNPDHSASPFPAPIHRFI